jgi:type II secretory pathway component GspD/PulD (secretin)
VKREGRWGLLVVAAIAATLACPRPSARAAEPNWPAGPFRYLVIDQDTRDVLQEFGNITNIPIAVSEQVRGHVRGPLPITTADNFLKRICENQGLVWYYDGSKLYISAASEIDSLMITLGPLRLQELSDRLDKLHIADSRYPLNTTQKADVILVSGPPRYLALVRQTYEAMKQAMIPRTVTENGVGDEPRVRVFRGSP